MAEQIITKTCAKCKQIKPLSEFHKSKVTKDGLVRECKDCKRERMSQYAKTEKGRFIRKRATTKYQRTEKGKKACNKYLQTKKGRAKQKRSGKQYRTKYPERIIANRTVNHAIRAGKLPRPNTL